MAWMQFMARRQSDEQFKRVCGVDPGLGITGYAIVEMQHGEYCVLEAGVLRRPRGGDSLPARLLSLATELDEVLGEYRPDIVAVEQLYAHYKHPRTAILMGHARGVLLLTAAKHKCTVLNLSATTVKRRLTGSGHASKQQMQQVIARTLGLRDVPEPPDVADALAIAICALHERPKSDPAPTRRVTAQGRKLP